jgi:hypothetical protein
VGTRIEGSGGRSIRGGVGMQIEGSGGGGGRGGGSRRVSGAFGGCTGRFLAGTLGSNGCKAFLLERLALAARHKAHVARTLLAEFEASERKQESRRF